MGLTPTGGVMMGTCSGDLDPGVLLFLLEQKGYEPRRLADLVNHEAGLLAVSGTSPDMKTLLEKRSGDPQAAAGDGRWYAGSVRGGSHAGDLPGGGGPLTESDPRGID